ncbi:hypothetical protein [Succinimonas amylolytica]|uniref:hypothetical protein n=1 Tax=Succinimonas amylolytica TaxID=83769 RepID=UPI00039BC9FF|nr:hypothetical protein [Succinimonas amylolytica]
MLKINSAEAGIAGYFIKISRLEMEILSAGCLRGRIYVRTFGTAEHGDYRDIEVSANNIREPEYHNEARSSFRGMMRE